MQYFLAHWAYYGLFRAPRAAFVRPYQFPLKSCGFPGAETARKRFLLWKMGFSDAAHCTPMHPLTSAWSFHGARKLACGTPCFIGLTTACFAHCARPSCAPPVSAKILRISGRGNCKETIFALENGIFRRGVLRVHAPLNSAWSSHCARRLACGTPCFIGLTTACFRHWQRPSCAPAVHAAGDDGSAKGLCSSLWFFDSLTYWIL